MADADSSNAALGLHHNAKNLIGAKYGRLEVISLSDARKNGSLVWNCRCECGAIKQFSTRDWNTGDYASCGCLALEVRATMHLTHGMCKTPEYDAWMHLIGRCENKNDFGYATYGGRGIKVCPRWRESFEAFLADVGPRPSPAHSIDRYPNNDGNYEPGNVRWATLIQQRRNMQHTRFLTFNGETLCIAEWSERRGWRHGKIASRLKRGWSVERTLGTA